ncbi:hypothetical protein B0H10DRAFT_2388817 [Mycena sp. CBHHK59/15]|nr:hypothetical protein B0H10DRAFT_2388817 [Mycena sp. CBHHK59/15]
MIKSEQDLDLGLRSNQARRSPISSWQLAPMLCYATLCNLARSRPVRSNISLPAILDTFLKEFGPGASPRPTLLYFSPGSCSNAVKTGGKVYSSPKIVAVTVPKPAVASPPAVKACHGAWGVASLQDTLMAVGRRDQIFPYLGDTYPVRTVRYPEINRLLIMIILSHAYVASKKQLLRETLLREICTKTQEVVMRESNVVHVSSPIKYYPRTRRYTWFGYQIVRSVELNVKPGSKHDPTFNLGPSTSSVRFFLNRCASQG